MPISCERCAVVYEITQYHPGDHQQQRDDRKSSHDRRNETVRREIPVDDFGERTDGHDRQLRIKRRDLRPDGRQRRVGVLGSDQERHP